MARINLSIDDDLFKLLSKDAEAHSCTVNVYLISILEGLYKQNPFDYQSALEKLIEEAKAKPLGEEFILFDLPSFSEICIAKAENAGLKPSIARARLGKMFNLLVRENKVGDVKRQRKEDNTPKLISRAAVYIRELQDNEREL